jgi:transcriptional antiterminator RfaH
MTWFVVLTPPHGECMAQVYLRQRGIKTLWLKIREKRLRRNKWVESFNSLFPGYLFVELDLAEQGWWTARHCPGVSGMIMNGDLPYPLPDRVSRDLLARCDSAGNVDFGKKRKYRPGAQVRIRKGPFADFLAKVIKADEQGRVTLLLTLFGRETETTIDERFVEAA